MKQPFQEILITYFYILKIRQALCRLLRCNKSVSKCDHEDLRSSVFSTNNNEWNTNFAFWNEDYTHQKDYNVKLWIDEYLLLSPLMPLWRVINSASNSSITLFGIVHHKAYMDIHSFCVFTFSQVCICQLRFRTVHAGLLKTWCKKLC